MSKIADLQAPNNRNPFDPINENLILRSKIAELINKVNELSGATEEKVEADPVVEAAPAKKKVSKKASKKVSKEVVAEDARVAE